MPSTDRRNFLRSSATISAAAGLVPRRASARPIGANDRVRVALLGLGGRMAAHVRSLIELSNENVEIVAICDCDQKKLERAEAIYPGLAGKKLARFTDMRKMFEDKSIDAVSCALGDRWHALSTIWACQAGKHVYVEKPGTHNLFEGRQMVAA
ncbi:MAG TPA: gfo/Idh/MocA family oxidoreductase, partial [Planctomycetaceae bacterium]|nr:gfo/Idh/MocA family oxidoreductase [Planctomycetaceae bacterium]